MACTVDSAAPKCGKGSYSYSLQDGDSATVNTPCNRRVDPKVVTTPLTYDGPQQSMRTCTPPWDQKKHECDFWPVHSERVDAAIEGIKVPDGEQELAQMANITYTMKEDNVVFMMNIGWVPSCKKFGKQDIGKPQGKNSDRDYKQILKECYTQCKSHSSLVFSSG